MNVRNFTANVRAFMAIKTNVMKVNLWTTQSALYSHKTWVGVWLVIASFSLSTEFEY